MQLVWKGRRFDFYWSIGTPAHNSLSGCDASEDNFGERTKIISCKAFFSVNIPRLFRRLFNVLSYIEEMIMTSITSFSAISHF